MKRIVAILGTITLTALFLSEIFAQNRSLGGTFSYAGTGVDYLHFSDSRHFAQYQLRLETSSFFWSDEGKLGISATAFWNTVFAQIESRNGNIVRFYAGPGISVGYSEDIRNLSGIVVGLKGSIGAECSFSRGVSLTLGISPMLGGHFRRKDGMVNMRLYRYGLCYGLMPEAGIRYIF
ncbi:MAG: hypothetical protein UD961_02950 [Bacteroidales bacterium]|jgi:hypothetical protein|nr:hypothetical protein [Bacteroidales bacterium]